MIGELKYGYSDWALLVAILMPFVVGVVTRYSTRQSRSWRWALGTTIVSALGNLFLAWEINQSGGGTRAATLLFRDLVSESIALFYSVVVLLLIWVMPKTERTRRTLSAVLMSEAMALLFFRVENPLLLGILWAARVCVLYPDSGKPRGHLLFQSLCIALVAGGLVVLNLYIPGFGTSRIPALVGAHRGSPWLAWVATLFFIAGSIRQGLFPFHVGLRAYALKAPFPVLFCTVTSNLGLYLLLRYCLPLVRVAPESVSTAFSMWVVVSLAYLSITVVTPDNVRKLFATLLSMQSSLIVIGMLQFDAIGSAGATIQWIVALMAAGGFGLCIWILQVRSGVENTHESRVAYEKFPRVAMMFLVFGMGVVDFPGTLGFIGEDLLVHSVLADSLSRGILVLAAMSAGSIAIYRAYVDLFLGRAMPTGGIKMDLKPREAFAFGFLLLILVGLGIYPTPVTGGMGVLATSTRKSPPSSSQQIFLPGSQVIASPVPKTEAHAALGEGR